MVDIDIGNAPFVVAFGAILIGTLGLIGIVALLRRAFVKTEALQTVRAAERSLCTPLVMPPPVGRPTTHAPRSTPRKSVSEDYYSDYSAPVAVVASAWEPVTSWDFGGSSSDASPSVDVGFSGGGGDSGGGGASGSW